MLIFLELITTQLKLSPKFLIQLKENLTNETAIILLNFSENYAVKFQSAMHGYNWDNSQSTLPFNVIYTENNEKVTPHN